MNVAPLIFFFEKMERYSFTSQQELVSFNRIHPSMKGSTGEIIR